MPKRKTHQQFIDELKLINPDIEILEEYVNTNTKILAKHLTCGSLFYSTPKSMLMGQVACPVCWSAYRPTPDEFSLWVKRHRYNYVQLEDYKNNETKINFLHIPCGNILKISPHALKTKEVCRYCNGGVKHNSKDFSDWIKENRPDYELIGEYKNISTKIEILHKDCNSKFLTTPTSFKNSKLGCPICNSGFRYTTQNLDLWIKENRPDYELIGECCGAKNVITIFHKKCNTYSTLRAESFKNRWCGCSRCNVSIGESKIEQYLISKNIKYIRQFSFNDCRFIDRLRFDFTIYDKNNNIYLIEFDGVYHFKEVKFAGGSEHLKITKKTRQN